jgi:uncharacterized membrane protein YbaN (DUF454 family)
VGESRTSKLEDAARVDPEASDAPQPGPDIEIDEAAGLIRVRDPRLIKTKSRPFCRRLVEAAVRRPTVRKVEVDLVSASCQVEFDAGRLGVHDIAETFADLIRQAGLPNSAARGFRRAAESEWLSLHAYPLQGEASIWETLEAGPGQLGLRNPRLAASPDRQARIAEAVLGLQQVKSCRIPPKPDRITIELQSAGEISRALWDELERIFEEVYANGPGPGANRYPALEASADVAPWPNRFMYLCLAGTSAVMTIVGLVVPGIPTVPFLLATSYFLARSSPEMNARLRRSSFFGPILTEWEEHGGLSNRSKRELTRLTLALFVVAIALAPLTITTIVIVLVVLAVSLAGLYRLPSAPEAPRIGTSAGGAAPLALAAL